MRTIPFGETGEHLSAMALGTMHFGTRVDDETARALLDAYADAGGRFIDTANMYTHVDEGGQGGEAETVIGRWLAGRGGRDELFIASKVGCAYPGTEFGLRADQIQRECEASLRRLGTDYLDLYFAHRDDGATPLEETLAAFDTLIREGKVRYIGASNFSAWRVSEARCFSAANGWEAYCCLQQRYSYLRPKPGAMFSAPAAMGAEHEELCRVRQIPVLAYSALIKGGYTRQDKDLRHQYVWADSDARLRALRGVAAEVEGATINKIVMAWLMRRSFPCIPLIGCSNPGQLAENLGALEVELSDEQVRRMDEAGV